MTLRDENPFVEQDLALIITTFEKKMVRSRDADSVFVGFRRDLQGMENIPSSVITAVDKLPASNIQEANSPDLVSSSEAAEEASDATEDSDSSDWKEDLKKKMEESGSGCIECDERKLFSGDVNFSTDLSVDWDQMLEKLKAQLPKLEDLFQLADVDLAGKLCELADSFKMQCGADLKKILFILTQLLNQLEVEMGADLGIGDLSLMSLLEPLLNEMIANLDLLGSLVLDPIKCVTEEIQRQIEEIPRTRSQFEAMVPQGLTDRARGQNTSRAEAQSRGEEVQAARGAAQRANSSPQRALDRVDEITNRLNQAASLERLKGYIDRGVNWLREKERWLMRQLQDLIDRGTDQFNDRMNFSQGKTDIMQLISLITAIIELAEKGEISCGADADSATQQDITNIINTIRHPSVSSNIFEEDGNVVVRRSNGPRSSREGGVRPGNEGVVRTGAESENATGDTLGDNIVVRRPIASCLKKVTQSEAEQVEQWIRQLEQEG